ncbi:MAG TPA: M67 family peptidase [Chloroflexi bacterium]|nr:M67 family peptidase [Chloroflexota bacterium]
MLLRYTHYLAMRRHVAAEAPLEACGLVAGRDGVSVAVYPIPNALHSPTRYRMDPRAQVQAFFAMEAAGLELLAIYHSHPQGPPLPSATDLREATYAVPYLIWARLGETWLVRAFLLQKSGQEVPLRLA